MEEKFKIYNEQEDKKQDETKEETEIIEEVTTEPKEETEIFEEVTAEPKEETIIEEVKETKVSQEKDDKSKLLIMILAIIILVFAILAVTIPNLIKKEEEKTVIVDKPELKSEYRMAGNNLQDFDINFLKLENKEVNKTFYGPRSNIDDCDVETFDIILPTHPNCWEKEYDNKLEKCKCKFTIAHSRVNINTEISYRYTSKVEDFIHCIVPMDEYILIEAYDLPKDREYVRISVTIANDF